MADFQTMGCTPPLKPSDVHLWWIEPQTCQLSHDSLWSVLDEAEQTRAQRFVKDRLTNHYVLAHGALRHLLGQYLQQAPSALRFQSNSHGKPHLDLKQNSLQLQFNLSHCRDQVLIGVSLEQPLGVDIEVPRDSHDILALAQRFFAPAESQALLALPQAEQLQAFYRTWTRKEAFVKGIGRGLAFSLESFAVSSDLETLSPVIAISQEAKALSDWSLYTFEPGPIMSLAVKKGNHCIQTFRWTG